MSEAVVADLESLREALRARRVEIARSAADLYNDKSSESWHASYGAGYGTDLRRVQEEIEAVQRAIVEIERSGGNS